MLVVLYGIFGVIVGSFLNVVVIRFRERGIGGRSGCMSCKAPLGFWELIPIASWIALKSTCKHCGSKISIQYPLVEFLAGIVFALFAYYSTTLPYTSFIQLAAYIGVGTWLIVFLLLIAVYDIRQTIIPDRWSLAFFLGAIVWYVIYHGISWNSFVISLVGASVVALPFVVLWAISRGRWMGLGDGKLALGIGALLGPTKGYEAILIAFWLGAIVSTTVLIIGPRVLRTLGLKSFIRSMRHTIRSEVPFGPYLIIGCILVWFFGDSMSIFDLFI